MTTAITFRGGESTGSVADRKSETAKQETTGSIGARTNQDSIFSVDNELKQDTICFRASATAYPTEQKQPSVFKTLAYLTGAAIGFVGACGLAFKYNLVGKITNKKARKFFQHTDVVTKPCHKACVWAKKTLYNPVVNFLKSK